MYPFLEVFHGFSGSADLPEPGDSGPHRESGIAPGWTQNIFGFGRGPRTNNAHLTEQDIHELRYFVDIRVSQKSADHANSGVIRHFELGTVDLADHSQCMLDLIGTDGHGPELQTVKLLSVTPLPFISKKHRTR
jgi:hypothetical protein